MPDPLSLTLQWPSMLWLLAALPVLAAFQLWQSRRGHRATLRYAGLGEIVPQRGAAARLRRYAPPALMLLGIAALVVAVARPQAALMLPARLESIVLAIDVSGSMKATDIAPDRITAARAAAKAFLDEQPRKVRIGVVSIAATAAVAQSPTTNRDDILQVMEQFQLQRGSAIGSGILIAMETLLPEAGMNTEKIISGTPPYPPGGIYPAPGVPEFKPVPPGSHGSGVIVLLSDGQGNMGPDPLAVAKIAAERGVRVFTVGVGSPEGATLSSNGWSMRVLLDEESLKKIAATTRGEYFRAGDAAALKKIYTQLSAKLVLEKQQTMEVTALFAALGALLSLCAALLSMSWFNRIA
jgi:Ca-activated chloride channel family protein